MRTAVHICPYVAEHICYAAEHGIMNVVNFDKRLSEYFAKLARKSVKTRMKSLSAKERTEIAQNAAKARWAKKKRKKK
jgi:hypothetical protein